MSVDRLESVLEDGEALRFDATVRTGGAVGLTDGRLLVVRDGRVETVPFENVDEVLVQSFDWFLGVMSVGLVGFGLYSTTMDPLLGLGFAVAGTVSFALTYRRRGRVRVEMHTKPKPLVFHLARTDPFEEAFERHMKAFKETREE
ncbi:hypothetical protein BRD00_14470 [Halobacteriales archaeon QS_8_69_26]|nr:MAG: hypothetical protein BRD00_14470 [Halobacteriales archaeon QS_8_69_26]